MNDQFVIGITPEKAMLVSVAVIWPGTSLHDAIVRCREMPAERHVDVLVQIGDETREFTEADFLKRLGFAE